MSIFEAGAAIVDITPDEDWFRARREAVNDRAPTAYATTSFTDGVAEPLQARTLVTRQDGKLMVLVTADLLSILPRLAARVREELGHRWGVNAARVAVTASHTHSAAPYDENGPYADRIVERMVASVQAAIDDLQPARIGATHGFCNDLSYYERIPVTGENAEQLGAGPEHIGGIKHSRDHIEARRAAGPIDPQVGVVRIDRADGSPRAVLVHFAAHPAVEIEPSRVSPDYVGFMANRLQGAIPGVVPLFCQGADGAVNINNIWGTLEQAKQHGEALGDEVLRVLESVETTDKVELTCVSKSSFAEFVPIPSGEELDEELAICRAYIEKLESHPDEVWLGYGTHTANLPPGFPPEARRRMVELRRKQLENVRSKPGHLFPPSPVELQMFRWNDIALVFNPFELFVQLGLEVKRLSPCRYTFPVCYANGCVGYLGPAGEIARGGYHFFYFRPGRYAPSNADRLVREMVGLIRQPPNTSSPDIGCAEPSATNGGQPWK